ncbi:MAG: hypothetical protein HYT30_01425 [Parcubacteria group bacterium]|nr:hypothetical protein [Parcubacteria group bacterium]
MHYSKFLTFICCIAACAALGGLGWIVLTVRADMAALADLEFAYSEAQQKYSYSASIKSLLRDIAGEREQLYMLTQHLDPVKVIHDIESAAQAAKIKMTVQAVKVGSAPASDPTLEPFIVSLEATGTFEQLQHFITLIELLPFPSRVEQIRLERREKNWHLEAVIHVYAEQANDL